MTKENAIFGSYAWCNGYGRIEAEYFLADGIEVGEVLDDLCVVGSGDGTGIW